MKKSICFGCLMGLLFLSGCTPAELENREFPTILSVSEDTDNFAKDWLNRSYEGNKKIDYNHLKVLVLEQGFIEDEAKMSELLTLLKQDKNIPLNTYVVVTENAKSLEDAAEALGQPLGDYIEELLEHAEGVKKETYPTLGMLYQEEANNMETLFLPYIGAGDDEPEIISYEVYKRGKAAGVATTDVAMVSFFLNNQLKELRLQLSENQFVKLSNTKNRIAVTEIVKTSGRIKKQVAVKICCDGEILYQEISKNLGEAEEMLEKEIKDYMENRTSNSLKQGVDATNSWKKYGGYMEPEDDYEDDIEVIFDLDTNWID